jgi:3-deoxy-D-manno-octulosonic-acid transferase
MRWLYRAGTAAYHLGIRAAAAWGNDKATAWVAGRRDYSEVYAKLQDLRLNGRRLIWVHAASLGEFEQARPVLRELRDRYPELAVVVTFYSPSGYARCRGTELADLVAYLPPDGRRNAREWLNALRPSLAVFVKYEFWFDHLSALDEAGVPTLLIAGKFRPDQPFFRWYGSWWRGELGHFTHFGVQTEADARLLAGIGYTNAEVTGDPRVDRVLQLAAAPFSDPVLEGFTAGAERVLLAGSVWPADVAIIAAAWAELQHDWHLVLAPHELHRAQLSEWQRDFSADRYTESLTGKKVLLLDTVGILSRAYRYGSVAYVGGGFGSGLHNTLEPMSYGLPVCFGPKHGKFPEAGGAVAAGGAFVVRNGGELADTLSKLARPATRRSAERAQHEYTERHQGAAGRTFDLIRRYLPLWLFLFASPLVAQSWSAADRLETCLDGIFSKSNLMVALSGTEWRPGLCLGVGRLREGESAAIRLELTAGHSFVFLASGEGAGSDIDLYLRRSDGTILATDAEADGTPIIRYGTDTAHTVILQLHVRQSDRDTEFAGFGILRSGGTALPRDRYREVAQRFGAAAGAVRAAGAATEFTVGSSGWAVLGYLVGREEVTLDGLNLPLGNNFVAVSAGDHIQDVDLFLADRDLRLLRTDTGKDAYPMLEYRVSEPGAFRLRLSIERAREPDLLLLGFFTH